MGMNSQKPRAAAGAKVLLAAGAHPLSNARRWAARDGRKSGDILSCTEGKQLDMAKRHILLRG